MDNLFYRSVLLVSLLFYSLNASAKQILNDPTRPGIILIESEKKQTKKRLKKSHLLSAIFIKQGKPQAIINNKLYQSGDFFSGKKIIAIKSNKVVLKSNSGISNLMLIQPVKKRKKP